MDRDDEADLAELIALVEGDSDQAPLLMEDLDLAELGAVKGDTTASAPSEDATVDEDTAELMRLVGRQRRYVVNHNEIPAGLIEYVRSITRTAWLADQVLERAASRILRRIRHDMPEGRRARWAKRWRPEEQDRTKRWLGRLRDEVVRGAHLGRVSQHYTYSKLPQALESWQPDETGALVIDEPSHPNPSFGSPGYLEQTPIKLLRWVHETWFRRRLEGLGDEPGLDEFNRPRVWDLTAGSGTSVDYFARLLGCEIAASDLVAVANGVTEADCRQLGLLEQHGGRQHSALSKVGLVVASPDIVLIDPPSRGLPLPSQVYGDGPRADDVALLDRELWIFTVADVGVRAVRHLADGGVVSLLVRCGVRHHGEVEPDPKLLDDLKTVLGDRVAIVDEMPIRYRSVRNQTSLGTNRVPAVHLLLARPS